LLCRFGSWGICFTYGTWFAVEGLSAVGKNYSNNTSIRKACKFLLSKQLRNGGWGESHLSSRTKVIISGMLCDIDEGIFTIDEICPDTHACNCVTPKDSQLLYLLNNFICPLESRKCKS
jgi:hypothetical protein